MSGARKIVCAGRLYCDLVFAGLARAPAPGTEVFADHLSLHAGGGAFITAATFCKLGLNTALLTTLPAEPFGTVSTQDMASSGVDLRYCQEADPGSDPQITVAVACGGDRSFLTRRTGAALRLPEGGFPWPEFRHLHLGELATALEYPSLLAQAKAAGLTISLDCGWDDAVMAHGSGIVETLRSVDVFLPNEMEYERLVQIGVDPTMAGLLVVKCGGQGARAYGPQGWVNAPVHAVELVDATGAGDAFNGGFLAGWLGDMPLHQSLSAGNKCGAAAVRAPGGTGGLAHVTAGTVFPQAGAAE